WWTPVMREAARAPEPFTSAARTSRRFSCLSTFATGLHSPGRSGRETSRLPARRVRPEACGGSCPRAAGPAHRAPARRHPPRDRPVEDFQLLEELAPERELVEHGLLRSRNSEASSLGGLRPSFLRG